MSVGRPSLYSILSRYNSVQLSIVFSSDTTEPQLQAGSSNCCHHRQLRDSEAGSLQLLHRNAFLFSVFFSVYSTAVDTLFICYLEDMERNDGSSSKPFIMSRQLRVLLGKMERSRRGRRGRLVHVKGREEQQTVFTVGH